MYSLGWKPGVRMVPTDSQGMKAGTFRAMFFQGVDLSRWIGPTCFYPETMPISLIRFEDGQPLLNLVNLPGELTRTAWRRIEKGLGTSAKTLPIGLANEYVGYVTTREEYAAQGYEGASTIYGPFTAELMLDLCVELSKRVHPPVSEGFDRVHASEFFPDESWSGERFGSDWLGAAHPDPDEALETLILDDRRRPERHWARFAWREKKIAPWDSSGRQVKVTSVNGGSSGFDDDGETLLTVFLAPRDTQNSPAQIRTRVEKKLSTLDVPPVRTKESPEGQCWMAIWLAPEKTPDTEEFQFSITPFGKPTVLSKPFSLGSVRKAPPGFIPPADGSNPKCE